jgi:trk system potassium uptake protein TrkA
MFAIIVGAGNTGQHVAQALLAEGHSLAIIERRADVFGELPAELAERGVMGDGSEPSVLERAGIRRADVLVATTNTDEDNLVVCSLAKREFDVPRTVARVNHPNNAWMYAKDLGVDVGISQAHIMADLIQAEVSVGDLTSLLRLPEGEVTLIEGTIAPAARAAGRTLGALALPAGALPVALLRGPSVLPPAATATLAAGDRLVILAERALENQVAEALR